MSFEILKDKSALRVFLSLLVSSICEKMLSIGLVWFLTKEFSVNIVPWFLALSFLPHLLMSVYSTAIINRVGELQTVILTTFFRALVLIILFVSIFTFSLEGHALLEALFAMGFFIGLGSSLFNPAILSLPPQLVTSEKVMGLNALIDSSMSISTILGATFAIFLLNLVNLKTLILINAAAFLFAGILQWSLRSSLKNGRSVEEVKKNLGLSPLNVLKKYPEIKNMLLSFLFLNLVFTPILVMIPWYVQNIYSGDSSALATIEGSMGLGAFLTGVYLSLSHFTVREEKRISMISIISFFFGFFFLLFSLSSSTWQGAIILFFIGILSTFLNIQVLTYFQMSLNESEIPAIMTAVNIISAATVPLSLGFSGLIFPHVSIPIFAKVSGTLVILIALILPKFLKGQRWKTQLN